MLVESQAGNLFKKLFMVLLESVIETSPCGDIRPKIGYMIEYIDNIKNINWCRYVISVIKHTHKNWLRPKRAKRSPYNGPLVFLMICFPCGILEYVIHGLCI